jgi:Flp pilus assembly protein TadG
MRSFFRLIDRFRRDKRANVAMIFGITAIPLISAIGCAVDYSMATRMRAKMQSAADAASVASLSQKSAGYTAAAAMTGNGSVTAGSARSPAIQISRVPASSRKPASKSLPASVSVPTCRPFS